MANNKPTGSFNDSIADSISDALLYLNSIKISEGKIYMKRYLEQASKSKVDVIVAVGISDGSGPACYKIISEAGRIVVWDIVDELPDISHVLHGQLYVYTSGEQNYLVYIKAGTRIVEPIKFPMITLCSKDCRLYYVSPLTVTDIYDHLENCSVMELRLTELEKKVEDLEKEIEDLGKEDPTTTTTTSTTPKPVEPPVEDTTTTTTTTSSTTPTPSVDLKIVSFVMDCDPEYEVGSVVNPKFTWGYNTQVSSQSINEESLATDLREKSYTGITSDTTFTLRASDGSKTVTSSKSIKFSPVVFRGSGRTKASAVTAENFYEIFTESTESGLSNVACEPGTTETKVFSMEQKSYVLLAYPVSVADKLVIYDLNNFEVTFETNDIEVTNALGAKITYRVYQSPSASTEFTFVFKYN